MTASDLERIAVIGIGNRFRGDDAVGPLVLDHLRGSVPETIDLIESDGDPAALVGWFGDADLVIVVDAVVAGGKPGTVYRFNGNDPLPVSFFRQSTHLLGVAEAVELARNLGKLPKELIVFGIECERFGTGKAPGARVLGATDDVASEIRALLTSRSATDNAAENKHA